MKLRVLWGLCRCPGLGSGPRVGSLFLLTGFGGSNDAGKCW